MSDARADAGALPIAFGDLRRVEPIDPCFGGSRGKPIDRHYIEGFLASHAADVRGRVLEVAEDHYTRRFASGPVDSDVLHVADAHPGVTIVADLADGRGLPDAAFDCFICTQTLQYVYALEAAVATMHRILKPGGVLLLTAPGISQISTYDRDRWGEHWRFTPQSIERLLRTRFDEVDVEGRGNVLAATSFLQGLACKDLTVDELDHVDPAYPMVVTARAVRASTTA